MFLENVTIGSQVKYTQDSELYPRQNEFASEVLDPDKTYFVQYVFPGENFRLLELAGIDYLFVEDLFAILKV